MKIKQVMKKFLPRFFFHFIRGIIYPEKIDILEDRLKSLFLTHYQDIIASNLSQKINFRNAEFKVYSKHGGDGILAYIFSKIGTTNFTFVEIGVENGRECNTANLSLNFGWNGLMIDANDEWVKSAQNFYKEKLGHQADKIKIVSCFVNAENVNKLLTDNGLGEEIDLLSIDIDSNDYWVWKSIIAINPRVVVMEYNSAFSLNSVTIKYDTGFYFKETCRENPLYFGASLSALSKLAKEKGYILVACDCHGHDAFFVRKNVAEGKFVELSPEEAFYPNPYTIAKFGSTKNQFELVKNLDLEEI